MKLCAASRGSESGVALVITLILLSVITFMAIAFLVLSRGQKSSVTTTTDQRVAADMAYGALARAEAELVAPVLALTNAFNYGMLVSTNYSLDGGFSNTAPASFYSSPLNANYFDRNGNLLRGKDAVQNIANLLYNPRPPVFITNRLAGSNDFRYYLDLNRNGVFDPSGFLGVTNLQGRLIGTNSLQGDPQWIGSLEFPDRPHAADNRFVGRYAYLVIPVSQTLDINYIHNYAKGIAPTTMGLGTDSFRRNQGLGTWEINFGSFLADLNTNIWEPSTAPYQYDPLNLTVANRGVAFDDALALLRYRYATNQATLWSVQNLFGPRGATVFANDFLDGYGVGQIMGVTWHPFADPDAGGRTRQPWSGDISTNRFFSPQDLFDVTKTGAFGNRLLAAGAQRDTYNRYTFYRLLSELGTDSAPEPANRININYDNLYRTNSSTNFLAWEPAAFFTNAANALLADAGYNFTITNIPIYPTNYYTAGVHRLLQLAVNIYDASTNMPFPTVMRPLFRKVTYGTTNVVFIAGYREVTNSSFASSVSAPTMLELESGPAAINVIPLYTVGPRFPDRVEPMVSGMPLVVGAKKGLPNFNEFSMQTYLYITRMLQFKRDKLDGPVTHTNQMYVVALTNLYGLEAWNSYSNYYPRSLQLIAVADMTAVITNDANHVIYSNRISRAANIPNINSWPGFQNTGHDLQSFILPFITTNYSTFLSNSTVANQPSTFAGRWVFPQSQFFDQSGQFYIPNWWLNLNTRLRFILVDTVANRIVDYVNLNHWEPSFYLTTNLTAGGSLALGDITGPNAGANQWVTNRPHGSIDPRVPTIGILNQIYMGVVAQNGQTTPDWNSFSMSPYAGQDVMKASQFFSYNLGNSVAGGLTFVKSNIFYAPFNSYAAIFISTSWKANDPLVHYNIGDLVDLTQTNNIAIRQGQPPWNDLGQVNSRYQPWGFTGMKFGPAMPAKEISAKDPLVRRSDDWDFPTNKFPNVGWLGRVHRGTPWQTVYLKSPNVLLRPGGTNVWQQWTGNPQYWGQYFITNNGQIFTNRVPVYFGNFLRAGTATFPDALYSVPTNDWRILDLFTAAINDNATRGQLSVNQTNLAAWSAVLGGVNVLADLTNNTFIAPAGVYDPANPPPLVRVVQGINNARTNFLNNSFQHKGDILAAPELTVASPYLTTRTNLDIMNDAVYERIPQQIMGLLRTGDQPRFVIYSYGQTLKPAPNSVIPNNIFGSQFAGLCTNYQIAAEVATRAVVRIDGAPTNSHAVVESFNVLPPD